MRSGSRLRAAAKRAPAERLVIVVAAALAASLLFVPPSTSSAWFPSQQMPDLSTPKGLYEAGCQYCHAADGRGADTSQLGFDVPLPDFSDCSFATREPDPDWFAIVHEGGPVRAFAQNMPAYYEAYSDEQIAMVVGYLRTFCTDPRWPRGDLNLPRPVYTEKAYPEDEAVFTLDAATETPGAITGELLYEKRIGPAGQIEIKVPLVIRQTEADVTWSGGIADIELGYKHTLAHSLEKGAIFSAGLSVVLPTGSEPKGFGKGTTVIEPFAAAGFMLPSDSFIHLQAGAELSTDEEKAEHEAFWRGVIGKTWVANRFGRSWTPMLEILGTTEFAGEGAENFLDLVPQVQVSLNTRQHILANFGVRVPVNETEGRSTRVVFYLLWDWYDGGFFDGW